MNQTQMRAAGILLILLAAGLGVTGLLLAKRPALYSATALVKVERDKIDLPELAGLPGLAAVASAGMDHTYFIETEIAVIKSDSTLSQVVTQLNLSQVWGQRYQAGNALEASETLRILRERLQIRPGPEMALINIRAASDVPAEAAELASATAAAYCQYRVNYRRRLAQTALDALAEKYADLEKQMAVAGERVEKTWQQLDPALQEVATTNLAAAESDALRKVQAQLSQSVLRYLAASNQLALLQLTNATAAEVVEQLKARAEKARTEMLAAEFTTEVEMRRLELLRRYQAARLDLWGVNQRFDPIQKAVAGLQNDLRLEGLSPASVVEPATVPTQPDMDTASRDRLILPGAGVAFTLGVGLVLFGRKTKPSAG